MLADNFELSADFLDNVRSEREMVRTVMTTPATCVAENTPIREVAQVMAEKNIKRIVVTRSGTIAGIVSRGDLVRVIARANSPKTMASLASQLPAPYGDTASYKMF